MSDKIKYKRQATKNLQQYDILKKHHKFLREDSDSDNSVDKKARISRQEKKGMLMAKQYYQQLYKEFCIVDLSQFQTGKIGCRWRTEKQVIKGKGQKLCAYLKCGKQSVNVFQMNFGYIEDQIKKNALVKISVCVECAIKLNFKKILKKIS